MAELKRPEIVARGSGTQSDSAMSLYRALLRAFYDAIVIVNEEGRIVDCNKRAQRFFLYDENDLCQLTINKIIAGFSGRILRKIRDDLAAGRFTVLDAFCVRKDETRFPVEVAISRITTASRDDLVFSIRNITRRRAMEERLRTEHNALQNSASGIVITDLEACVTYANPAFLALGNWDEEAAIGRDIRSFWQADPEVAKLVDAPQAGNTWSGELDGKRKSGRMFHVQGTASPNRNSKGKPVGMVYSFVDITEQYAAQQAIRREAEAQMESVSTQDEFSGRLNIITLSDLFQLIHSTGKTGTLVVLESGGRAVSRAAFAQGELVGAQMGSLTGEQGAMQLLREGGEAFQFEPGEPSLRGGIQKSVITLLMESAQSIDEDG